MDLPDTPRFIEPYRDESGGVDFLGLRQVNLDLMDGFLPGINNVTHLVRPYSLIAWTAWKFIEASKATRAVDVGAQDYKHFREKVELLFTWGHQLNGADVGLAGRTSMSPGRGQVPLSFEAWKRNVSLIDAVNYGPSLKTDNGLGFIHQVRAGLFTVTESGRELAEALEQRIGKTPYAARLASVADTKGTADMASGLFPAWDVRKASTKEKAIFARAFYSPEAIGQDSRLGRRSAAVQLILEALRAEGVPSDEWDIRRAMLFGATRDGKRFDLDESLQRARSLWVALQTRQAQRLALEVLFSWVERQVIVDRCYLSAQLVDAACAQLPGGDLGLPVLDTPEHYLQALRKRGGKNADLLEAGIEDESLDLISRMSFLQDGLAAPETLPGQALEVLFLAALLTEQWIGEPSMKAYLEHGSVYRVSLASWADFVLRNRHQPLRAFLSSLIENYLLSQHFGVAASRYESGKQRLRLTIEERGLVPMIGEAHIWEPGVTPDRLKSTLSLMADYGALAINGDGEYSVAAN